jgi:superoxide dismutase, Fe-Mn family
MVLCKFIGGFMSFELPSLPYEKDALVPYISVETVDYHYGKHHKAYVDNLNRLIADNVDFSGKSLEEIILYTSANFKHKEIFNNAAQVWNHTFYWHSMKKNGGGQPSGELLKQIINDFGSYQGFYDEFTKSGLGQFGSGWVWLVWDKKSEKLSIMKTPNAELPMVDGLTAILTSDVWEHAYYIDYRNKRGDYLKVFLDKLVNWNFASKNFDEARR